MKTKAQSPILRTYERSREQWIIEKRAKESLVLLADTEDKEKSPDDAIQRWVSTHRKGTPLLPDKKLHPRRSILEVSMENSSIMTPFPSVSMVLSRQLPKSSLPAKYAKHANLSPLTHRLNASRDNKAASRLKPLTTTNRFPSKRFEAFSNLLGKKESVHATSSMVELYNRQAFSPSRTFLIINRYAERSG